MIDVEGGSARVGGNKSLFLKLITKFKDAGNKHYTEIEDEIKKEDWSTATRVAHTLKRVAGNLGINEVFEEAGKVEALLKERDSGTQGLGDSGTRDSEVEKAKSELKDKVDEVLVDLEKLDSGINESRVPESRSLDEVDDQLHQLKTHLENDDPASKQLLEEVGSIVGHENDIKSIKKYLEEYDFDEALSILMRILR